MYRLTDSKFDADTENAPYPVCQANSGSASLHPWLLTAAPLGLSEIMDTMTTALLKANFECFSS
jgi:hypothetical protein